MAEEDYVANDERLYRSVRNSSDFFKLVDGKLRFSSTAFNDMSMKPSVDRAKLRTSPEESKLSASDGIVQLLAEEVRSISKITNSDAAPGEPAQYSIDVIPRPIPKENPDGDPENLAHAQIEANPGFKSPSRFKKLKEALAQLADKDGWIVIPSEA